VYAVPFDITSTETSVMYSSIFERLLGLGLVDINDLVILTKGELSGVSGGTNSMQILRVVSRL
jgi:pyruvate kinase